MRGTLIFAGPDGETQSQVNDVMTEQSNVPERTPHDIRVHTGAQTRAVNATHQQNAVHADAAQVYKDKSGADVRAYSRMGTKADLVTVAGQEMELVTAIQLGLLTAGEPEAAPTDNATEYEGYALADPSAVMGELHNLDVHNEAKFGQALQDIGSNVAPSDVMQNLAESIEQAPDYESMQDVLLQLDEELGGGATQHLVETTREQFLRLAATEARKQGLSMESIVRAADADQAGVFRVGLAMLRGKPQAVSQWVKSTREVPR